MVKIFKKLVTGLTKNKFGVYWNVYTLNIGLKNLVTPQGQTLSPGFIDPHLHPSMAALILIMDFITPFDWDFPWGQVKGKG